MTNPTCAMKRELCENTVATQGCAEHEHLLGDAGYPKHHANGTPCQGPDCPDTRAYPWAYRKPDNRGRRVYRAAAGEGHGPLSGVNAAWGSRYKERRKPGQVTEGRSGPADRRALYCHECRNIWQMHKDSCSWAVGPFRRMNNDRRKAKPAEPERPPCPGCDEPVEWRGYGDNDDGSRDYFQPMKESLLVDGYEHAQPDGSWRDCEPAAATATAEPGLVERLRTDANDRWEGDTPDRFARRVRNGLVAAAHIEALEARAAEAKRLIRVMSRTGGRRGPDDDGQVTMICIWCAGTYGSHTPVCLVSQARALGFIDNAAPAPAGATAGESHDDHE